MLFSEPIHISFYPSSILSSSRRLVRSPCTLAWKIPWMEEPGGLQSMGSLGVRHD